MRPRRVTTLLLRPLSYPGCFNTRPWPSYHPWNIGSTLWDSPTFHCAFRWLSPLAFVLQFLPLCNERGVRFYAAIEDMIRLVPGPWLSWRWLRVLSQTYVLHMCEFVSKLWWYTTPYFSLSSSGPFGFMGWLCSVFGDLWVTRMRPVPSETDRMCGIVYLFYVGLLPTVMVRWFSLLSLVPAEWIFWCISARSSCCGHTPLRWVSSACLLSKCWSNPQPIQ